MVQLALYQPEIPQNTGTLIRLTAALSVPLHVIEPCGFVWNQAKLRRAHMDYLELAQVTRHVSWESFFKTLQPCPLPSCLSQESSTSARLILLNGQAASSYLSFSFQPQDILLVGRESDGVPQHLQEGLPHQVRIPMPGGGRSLNMAIAAAMVLGEALRQTRDLT